MARIAVLLVLIGVVVWRIKRANVAGAKLAVVGLSALWVLGLVALATFL